MMLHPATELLPPASSPTISSLSSSDFDTESTGSFFHDRSTSLGTLMGVTTSNTFRTPPTITRRSTPNNNNNNRNFVARRRKKDKTADLVAERRRKRVVRRRNWWWLCSGEASKPSSLGEFLEVERRFGVEALFDGVNLGDHHNNNGRMLFAEGRVLPPPHSPDVDEGTPSFCSLCRFHILLAGICGGGGGGVR